MAKSLWTNVVLAFGAILTGNLAFAHRALWQVSALLTAASFGVSVLLIGHSIWILRRVRRGTFEASTNRGLAVLIPAVGLVVGVLVATGFAIILWLVFRARATVQGVVL